MVDQSFGAPAAVHASNALVDAASELGPCGGIDPPIHERTELDGSPIAELFPLI